MFTKDENGNTVYRHDSWAPTYYCTVIYEYRSTALFQPTVKETEYFSFNFDPEKNHDKVLEYLENQSGIIEDTVKIISITRNR